MSTLTGEKSQTDEWNTTALDVDAYLRRIGHPRVEPSAAALRSLTEAHVRAIPFENIDVILRRHRGLALDVVAGKLVGRQRGGYCYEHALLFAAVLENLGFEVRRSVARVQPDRSGPRTHMILVVRADGIEHLVDVGFGAGQLYPAPLRDGALIDQAGWEHRVTRDGALWTLAKRTGEGWEILHEFDGTPQRPIDYEVFHHYVSTHPRSPFYGQLVVMRLDHGVNKRLVGDTLTVEHADGRVERTPVTAANLEEILRGLDVVLDAEELAALRQWWETRN
ncbi:arylamine N-acetyltransferase family protein [Amycolatopsis anabasis]|uniref:arylamine N-acetyltransferase family protein n=1 Tax=Amycolatopsis anabasis TaxID=1840409 RepID=UPI00131E042C|nr:arylamine N-acetyltransferase [Amycolatopsis anabasis]